MSEENINTERIDRIKQKYENLYDKAAEEYKIAILKSASPNLTKTGKLVYRSNAKTWKERMEWLDKRLKDWGEE